MIKTINTKLVLAIVPIIASIFFLAHSVNAAQVSVITNNSVSQDQDVQVQIILDTQGASANAVQGKIIFPQNLFSLEKINDGSSAVSFWINSPKQSAPGEIDFAGIIPGGFNGSNGEILSFTLQPLANGTGTIAITTSTVLANDGQGSPLPVTLVNAAITVNPSSLPPTLTEPSHDEIAPNSFTPQIVSDPNIFGGKYFLVFNTTDDGSGVDHYEVLEVPSGASEQPFSSWHVASSPYLLTDQALSSDIYVRAVDHDGNFIVVKLPARYPQAHAKNWYITIILVIILVLLLGLWIRRRRRGHI
jgi:hypothetical protein